MIKRGGQNLAVSLALVIVGLGAIAAARLLKFTPAMLDGRPVSMHIQLVYYFNLY